MSGVAPLLACGCDGPGNSGQSSPDAALVEAVPWTNGMLPAVDGGQAVLPALPEYPAIATGAPDPGSRPVDCSALANIETSPGWVDTFEPDLPGDVGVAPAWAAFDDLSQYAFHAPGDVTWYPGLTGMFSAPWGLPAVPVGGPSCDGKPNGWSLHYVGGLFRNWGGGVSHVFTDPGYCPPGGTAPDFCVPPPAAGAVRDGAGLPTTAPDGGAYDESHSFVDASAYEGVAFWARRGPESQDRLLVTVTDNFTSDRLARQNQTYCRRAKPCYPQCLNGAPCTLDTSNGDPTSTDPDSRPIYRCFDPQAGAIPSVQSGNAPTALIDLMYPRCGPSACTSPLTYRDGDFDGKQCQPYLFPAEEWYIAGNFCFNPGDAPPPDRDERCLDGWVATVQLTPDWQYYTVPFSSMLQGGFGKVARYFNLKAIDTVALGFVVGWADVYIDNVSFYRRKQ